MASCGACTGSQTSQTSCSALCKSSCVQRRALCLLLSYPQYLLHLVFSLSLCSCTLGIGLAMPCWFAGDISALQLLPFPAFSFLRELGQIELGGVLQIQVNSLPSPCYVLILSLISSASRVLGLVLSGKYLQARRAVAISVEFTVWLLWEGLYVTNCRALRRKVEVSRTALMEKVMHKLRWPVYRVPAEHIPNRTMVGRQGSTARQGWGASD